MRPRSIGTRSSVASGAAARTKASKRSASATWMSTKYNDGALSGSAAIELAAQIAVDLEHVTSSARPRPSDSTTLGVSAPGPVDVGDHEAQRRSAACGIRARDAP